MNIHLVEITGLSHEGFGVGRVDGRVVFVPLALPGDLVQMKVTEKKGRFSLGQLIQIENPSADRVPLNCPHAEICGGCQLQPLAYQAQLFWKRRQVEDALARIGGLEAEVLPVIGMDEPYFYRNKAQFKLEQESLGFYQRKSHEVVDLHTCRIQHPLIMKLALAVKQELKDLNIKAVAQKTGQGVLRQIVIRASFAANQLMLILVTRAKDLPREKTLVSRLRAAFPELISIVQIVQPNRSQKTQRIIWGKKHLEEMIGHLAYAISPGSFFQVNPLQTKILYDLIRQNLALTGTEIVLDLYCGAGTIGLYLAERAGQVIGVESYGPAICDAIYNARLNGYKNTEFLVGKAEMELPKLLEGFRQVDIAVLDPPRKGCAPALLETLSKTKISRILYVSCNPATLARDLAILKAAGYALGPVQPVDLFPWTSHVECVVLMSRIKD